jgi:uncharacterized membrane protein required for colicin V production
LNWLDFVLLAIIVVSGIAGMRIGLIKAAFAVAGVVVGWLLAGQLSDDVGALFDSSLSNDTVVTVISYAIIVIASAVVASYIGKIVKPMLTILTLGLSKMVDRLVGLALGLLLGIAVAGAVVMAGTRLTYDFDTSVLDDRVPGQVADRLPQIDGARESLEDAMAESALVGVFVDVTDALPASALGFAPSDFKLALRLLEAQME